MPVRSVFLDDDHRIVPEHLASRMVETTTDANGVVLSERWSVLEMPRDIASKDTGGVARDTPLVQLLLVGLAGALLGWLVGRR